MIAAYLLGPSDGFVVLGALVVDFVVRFVSCPLAEVGLFAVTVPLLIFESLCGFVEAVVYLW